MHLTFGFLGFSAFVVLVVGQQGQQGQQGQVHGQRQSQQGQVHGQAHGQSQQGQKISSKYNEYYHPQQQQIQRPKQPQKQPQNPDQGLTSSEELELEEEQKPDRLQELLTKSKFLCSGKKDGYYADDGLDCEVFHYCLSGAKHSWLCPDGFSFHQIHLICVPPSSDNMCSKSPDYHFVNEYLYKPVNANNPYNETLRYADRFFPDGYSGAGNELLGFRDSPGKYYSDEEESEEVASLNRNQNQNQNQVPREYPKNHFVQQQAKSSVQKAYFDPNLINIPLQQRRPVGFRPSPQLVKKEFY